MAVETASDIAIECLALAKIVLMSLTVIKPFVYVIPSGYDRVPGHVLNCLFRKLLA